MFPDAASPGSSVTPCVRLSLAVKFTDKIIHAWQACGLFLYVDNVCLYLYLGCLAS